MKNGFEHAVGYDSVHSFEIVAILSSYCGGDWHMFSAIPHESNGWVKVEDTLDWFEHRNVVRSFCVDCKVDEPLDGKEYPFLVIFEDGLAAYVKARCTETWHGRCNQAQD